MKPLPFIAGLVTGLAILTGIAATQQPKPGPVGRYQLDRTGNTPVIIDTTTGQLWMLSKVKNQATWLPSKPLPTFDPTQPYELLTPAKP